MLFITAIIKVIIVIHMEHNFKQYDAGQEELFTDMYERYKDKMMALCMRYSVCRQDAEDLMQDACIQAYLNMYRLRNDHCCEGWLRRIITNTMINKIRNNKRRYTVTGPIAENEYTIANGADTRLRLYDVISCLDILGEAKKKIFIRRALMEDSHRDIGITLGIEEATSRQQFSRAVKIMGQQIEHLRSNDMF